MLSSHSLLYGMSKNSPKLSALVSGKLFSQKIFRIPPKLRFCKENNRSGLKMYQNQWKAQLREPVVNQFWVALQTICINL